MKLLLFISIFFVKIAYANDTSNFSEKEKADHYVKFNEKVLLRGDLQARKDFYTAMVYSGNMTRNEVRALEDMNPLEGLDEPLQPVNMQALSLANQLIQEQNGNSSK